MEPVSDPQLHPVFRGQAFLGTAALALGTILVCLGLIAELDGRMPFFMPRSWYVNRPLWYFFALSCFVGGSYLMKHRSTAGGTWQASRPGIRFRSVTLYTRAGCGLCDTAKGILEQYEDYLPPVEEVDITTDHGLIEKYGTCVPVIVVDDKVRFRGRLDEQLLRRLIEGTAPLDA
jgi:glutaredoxin